MSTVSEELGCEIRVEAREILKTYKEAFREAFDVPARVFGNPSGYASYVDVFESYA